MKNNNSGRISGIFLIIILIVVLIVAFLLARQTGLFNSDSPGTSVDTEIESIRENPVSAAQDAVDAINDRMQQQEMP